MTNKDLVLASIYRKGINNTLPNDSFSFELMGSEDKLVFTTYSSIRDLYASKDSLLNPYLHHCINSICIGKALINSSKDWLKIIKPSGKLPFLVLTGIKIHKFLEIKYDDLITVSRNVITSYKNDEAIFGEVFESLGFSDISIILRSKDIKITMEILRTIRNQFELINRNYSFEFFHSLVSTITNYRFQSDHDLMITDFLSLRPGKNHSQMAESKKNLFNKFESIQAVFGEFDMSMDHKESQMLDESEKIFFSKYFRLDNQIIAVDDFHF
jgi:hypothetical protein